MNFNTIQSGKLTIAVGNYDCPMLNYLEGNTRRGYEIETAEAVCKLLHLEPVWVTVPPADFYTNLNTDRYDVVWFIQTITAERQAIAHFSRPYCAINDAILVMKDSAIHAETDLAGLQVGALTNTTLLALAKKKFANAKVIAFPGSDNALSEMLDALRTGKVDALIDDEPILMGIANDIPDFRVAFTIPTQAPFGVVVSQRNAALLAAINNALNAMLANGSLEKLWRRYVPFVPFLL
ncbi:MAG: ABC transporter arginine-binding protein 1 [Chroococcidiopsis cubana SAG 39.79]|uniref:ABC transporter substrate-binding protein n=1 Tax=Chroococcidiopsis cubana SAG 39.79 TaxID=388085 RepID=A0AB37UEQ3_9CYAN|nr:ABC transporter substrate-binding protein [Chroococcidiopsis cubana]MDZ4872259.1 ABC transporter arginine-binding protein 1 [Chroococcidiopsis cubana SAG 39.79]PSB60948.1 amino acid ABC transporter substrate-binding protein [Chroococcidiopsis cubana CCALA 043]RUT07404.1 ABC transporter substrate-binding protein [Chroococcidiopsis cubana SAG 39.79]